MVIREIFTRFSFKVDTTPLKAVDNAVGTVKKGIGLLAATAVSGWAIKAGTNIEILKEQFNQLEGRGASPLRNAMAELGAKFEMIDAKGKKIQGSIFKDTDLLRSAVALRRMGFAGTEAEQMLRLAGQTAIRFGGSITDAVQELGSGVMEGGIVQTLRGIGLVDRETEVALKRIEAEIASSTGVAAELATRQWRRKVLEVVQKGTPELKKEFDIFTKTHAAAAMASSAAIGNMWDDLSSGIVRAMKPALRWITDVLTEARKLTPIFSELVNLFTGETDEEFPLLSQLLTYLGFIDDATVKTKSGINELINTINALAVGAGGGALMGLIVGSTFGMPKLGMMAGAALGTLSVGAGMKARQAMAKADPESMLGQMYSMMVDMGMVDAGPTERIKRQKLRQTAEPWLPESLKTTEKKPTPAVGMAAPGGTPMNFYLNISTQSTDKEGIARIVTQSLKELYRQAGVEFAPGALES